MRIVFAGDWHGDTEWAVAAIGRVAEHCPDVDTILHVGDFGIWPGPGGRAYLNAVNDALTEHGLRLRVTPGNHEDWGNLTHEWATNGPDAPLSLRDRIDVLPRGFRFTVDGRSFVSLGGAPSIDYEWRVPGLDWWPEEMITDADVERVVADGYADVMITHDAPSSPWTAPAVASILAGNPMGWSRRALNYAEEGRFLLDRALHGVRPRVLFHGHMHAADHGSHTDGDWTLDVFSLGMNGQDRNLAVLDTADLSVEWVSE